MKNPRLLLSSLIALTPVLASGADKPMVNEAEIPAGVVYAGAEPKVIETARERLRAALHDGPEALAQLMGVAEGDARVLVGPYFGVSIEADNLKGRNMLTRGRYHFPIPGEAGLVVNSFGARSAAEKRFVAHYVYLAGDFSGELEIRPVNFDELALVWGWISWDLDDPLFVVESARDKFVFDFDPRTGLITWIERFSNTCFSGYQEGKQVLECHCSTIARDGKNWRVNFEALASCPAPAVNDVKLAAAKSVGATTPVYLRTDDRVARVDAMLARVYASTHQITVLSTQAPGYQAHGTELAGAAPVGPKDGKGDTIHGYVLIGAVLNADTTISPIRVLVSSDERLSNAALEAMRVWRVEPPKFEGKPVAELFWQEFTF
jgi:hypothetical protein